tara:strand:+ start:1152 stop:1838 length:687 start_codon:yes stop_codon:yes gene_type:complete
MTSNLEFISKPPIQESTATPPILVLFHGYGANMHDLIGLSDIMDPRLKIIAAQAPIDLGPHGMPGGRAWFHLHQDERGEIRYDQETAFQCIDIAAEFIDQHSGDSESAAPGVLAMGFSQGAMIAHALLLQQKAKLDGIAACSGRLVEEMFRDGMGNSECVPENMPILLTHGSLDPLIPIQNGHALRDFYASTPAQLTWVEEPIGHGIGPRSAEALSNWSRSAVDRILG